MRIGCLALLVAGCTNEPKVVEATVAIRLAGTDLAATTVTLEAEAWIETHMHGDTSTSAGPLDVRMKVDDAVIPMPGSGHFEAEPQTGFPTTLVLLVEDRELSLPHSDAYTVQSTPIAEGYRLTFAPPQAAGEHVTVSFSTTSQPYASVAGAGEGATYVDVPADASYVNMRRNMRQDGDRNADIVMGGVVYVERVGLTL